GLLCPAATAAREHVDRAGIGGSAILERRTHCQRSTTAAQGHAAAEVGVGTRVGRLDVRLLLPAAGGFGEDVDGTAVGGAAVLEWRAYRQRIAVVAQCQ